MAEGPWLGCQSILPLDVGSRTPWSSNSPHHHCALEGRLNSWLCHRDLYINTVDSINVRENESHQQSYWHDTKLYKALQPIACHCASSKSGLSCGTHCFTFTMFKKLLPECSIHFPWQSGIIYCYSRWEKRLAAWIWEQIKSQLSTLPELQIINSNNQRAKRMKKRPMHPRFWYVCIKVTIIWNTNAHFCS